jgi:hypothetical protein
LLALSAHGSRTLDQAGANALSVIGGCPGQANDGTTIPDMSGIRHYTIEDFFILMTIFWGPADGNGIRCLPFTSLQAVLPVGHTLRDNKIITLGRRAAARHSWRYAAITLCMSSANSR